MAERSQSLNRFLARRNLLGKIELMSDEKTEADIKRDKARKQKARQEKKSRAKYAAIAGKEEATDKDMSIPPGTAEIDLRIRKNV